MTDISVNTIEGPVLALIGPTAIGKTALSLQLSLEFGCEIISVDSMQVYRHMDIGTAKASRRERTLVPHHLIDIVDPDQDYHAARFVQDCLRIITEIHQRGAVPLMAGGTGLYLQALKYGLFEAPATDPEIRARLKRRLTEQGSIMLHRELNRCDPATAARLHPHDGVRIIRALEVYLATGLPMSNHIREQNRQGIYHQFNKFLSIGLTCQRGHLYERINERTAQLFEQGLETEVRGLLDMGYGPELKSMQSIGYRHMLNHISGAWNCAETVELLARDTRRYAKRQCTWFNRDKSITWFDRAENDTIVSHVRRFLTRQ